MSSQDSEPTFISRPALQCLFFEEEILACPYFVPHEILTDGSWPHPLRLPLGAGWAGNCRASGQEIAVSDSVLHESCNLGYATGCPHLPHNRDWDAIRFSIAHASRDQLTICFVCEFGHAPLENGKLIFDLATKACLNPPSDARVLTLAACYIETYRLRQSPVLA